MEHKAADHPLMTDLRTAIREIPDFPKEGIRFYDITTLLKDARCFQRAVDALANPHIGQPIDYIVGIDARGFILGAAVAYKLCKGLVVVRKKGKLPARTRSASYALEYGIDEV
jgi:adenine phosphoribosyltransferase